jgi:RimJ/RimL family protein N-acetyltransferase
MKPIGDFDLKTRRLVLEPLVPSHAAAIYEDLLDPRLYSFIPQDPPTSAEELRAKFTRLASRTSPDGHELWLNWVARFNDGNCYIGRFEASVYEDGSADIAYSVFPKFWRLGLAKEACEAVLDHLRRLYGVSGVAAEIDTRNLASIGLIESLGFERIGFIESADSFKGSRSDEYRYELRADR